MGVKISRGDVVVCALQGDYGKPRPAIVIQSDLFNSTHASVTLCPITSHLIDAPMFRIRLDCTKQNGIKKHSQVMADKIITVKKKRIRKKIGLLSKHDLSSVNLAVKLWLNLCSVEN